MLRRLLVEKKVEQLKKDIKAAEKEIEKLQKSCKHERQKLKMTDKHEIRWFCEECDSMTKFATPEEITQYLS